MDEPPSNTIFVAAIADPDYAISLISIALLLMISAMISASEVAFFSLKPDDLSKFDPSQNQHEKKIIDLLSRPSELLATILILNNLVNIGIISTSTLLMWKITGTHDPLNFVVGLVIFSVTFTITFFGEIIPKVYATKNNMALAKATVSTWKILMLICKPISLILLSMNHLVEKRLKKKNLNTTVEELNLALDLATINDESSADEKEILKGIVNFGTLTVKQVMRSRMDISAADINLNFGELMDYINKSGFSRIPIYRESIDKIEGVLYIKDLLPFMDHESNFVWQNLLRPGFFIPETKKIDSLLKDFQEKRVHMAIVVDEYGGTSGLITLEDIIEEIIGDINDEFDEIVTSYQKIDEITFLFEAQTSLHDFCKVMEVDDSHFDSVKGESESLGGLILTLCNEFPKAGDHITFEPFTFTIDSVDRNRIKKIKVHVHEEQQG